MGWQSQGPQIGKLLSCNGNRMIKQSCKEQEVSILAKIVVVEDDSYMREELISVLIKSGYEAFALREFENAVDQIVALAPDLILLDINLPYQSGFEICRALKTNGGWMVLVLTARDKLPGRITRTWAWG